ncbi:hypothetical protein DH2020_025126 [Rehmannia glutinosa]|uniref:Ferroxidase n=1 Tax=Rehmannia glutinosa TaxID=99300 RepID=A0ABR0W4U8_REHGL
MAIRSLRRTTLLRALKPLPSPLSSIPASQSSLLFSLSDHSSETSTSANSPPSPRPNFSCNSIFCRRLSSLSEESLGPAAIDYRSVLQEDEYHRLAHSTIHHLLEKLEEYGDSVEIDGFDVDYGNEVLTLKLGSLGTYVINKQTPNRQIWMSSPVSSWNKELDLYCPQMSALFHFVTFQLQWWRLQARFYHNGLQLLILALYCGPSRFDWDQDAQAWIYRRTKQNLIHVLETELEKLCEKPISLS